MASKVKQRDKLLEYLSNPDNEILNREELSLKVLGYAHGSTIHKAFTPEELTQIETEALAMRRTRYAGPLAAADKGLLKRAKDGDPAAVKLCYQRFEDWSERKDLNVTGLDIAQGIFAGRERVKEAKENEDGD